MNIAQALQELGFTEYEARAYTVLAEGGELSGYEVAKGSGIPRANIYAVLDKLLARGAAQRLQNAAGTRYCAVPARQLLHSIETSQKRALVSAKRALARKSHKREPAAVFNLRNAELLTKARQLIDATEHSLVVAIQQPEAAALANPLSMASERGVAVTTLCLQACEQECGGCQGDIQRCDLAPEDGTRWLVLVADEGTTLIGQVGENTTDGITTEQSLVVKLATAYVQQNMLLASLNDELADKADNLLSADTRQKLARLGPASNFPAQTQSPHSTTSS